mgnify:FL=1
MEFYGYFDSIEGDEREYDAAQFAHLLRAGMQNGVTSHAGGGLKVTAPGTGMTTRAGKGGCVVNGYLFVLEDDGGSVKSFTHGNAGAADRWDRIVVRLDTTTDARKITLEVKEGTPGADPAPPELSRSGNVYELSLAKVKIRAGAESIEAADVVDERGDASVCGYAVPVWLKTLTDFQPSEMEERLAELEASDGQKAAPVAFTAVLTASGWTGSAAPYTQTVVVTGLKASDEVIADVDMSGATAETCDGLTESWALVGTITTANNQITARCWGEKPENDLTVRLLALRVGE